ESAGAGPQERAHGLGREVAIVRLGQERLCVGALEVPVDEREPLRVRRIVEEQLGEVREPVLGVLAVLQLGTRDEELELRAALPQRERAAFLAGVDRTRELA